MYMHRLMDKKDERTHQKWLQQLCRPSSLQILSNNQKWIRMTLLWGALCRWRFAPRSKQCNMSMGEYFRTAFSAKVMTLLLISSHLLPCRDGYIIPDWSSGKLRDLIKVKWKWLLLLFFLWDNFISGKPPAKNPLFLLAQRICLIIGIVRHECRPSQPNNLPLQVGLIKCDTRKHFFKRRECVVAFCSGNECEML